ncbi:HD domain-containing protein [Alistipes provencensis]|uniref:HD domain-containing protein n=1 Tax=Alistipes provencensis TaxID=1816676 RepID=UPI0007ED4CC7|nr:HD domain-containing protein [Alistipes provencensis]
MEKLEHYLRFMREAERLKNVLRSAHTSTGRHESTAEHTWRLALLALVLADEKPELDQQRVLAMCLVHDLGEAYEGDIPAVEQSDPAVKAAAERSAMERLAPLLPDAAAVRIRALWEEYETCATPEARWVKALDKAETILQHNQGANPAGFDYDFNLTYGAEWFRDDALLRELRSLLDAETARHVRR